MRLLQHINFVDITGFEIFLKTEKMKEIRNAYQ